MLVSKPKVSTLFSVGIFLILAYGAFLYALFSFLESEEGNTVSIILILTTGPIALTVTLKTLIGIKIMSIAKEKFSLNYPFRFKKVKFTGKELESWNIDKIKTFGGVYEELVWQTKDGKKYSISRQEHSEFDKVKKYMTKKFKKLQQS
ncbi:MAG: hypothetical protein JXQ96_20685 [Cyclobacteriaceae bacterium]